MLLGQKCQGMVIHELSKDKTKKNAKLVGVEPYREVATAPSRARAAGATAVMERPSVAQVSADPSTEEVDLALLISSVERKIRQAEVLQTPKHLNWLSMDLKTLDAEELEAVKAAVQHDIDSD
jgi:hypothetical protein